MSPNPTGGTRIDPIVRPYVTASFRKTVFKSLHNLSHPGLLTPSENREYLLNCIDRFARWPEAVSISNISAETVAGAFISQWVSRFGLPSIITTDQGRQFESNLFSLLSKILGVQKIRTTPYHPSSNGIVQRFHRSLKQSLRCHASTKWTESVPVVLLELRTALKEDLRAYLRTLLWFGLRSLFIGSQRHVTSLASE
ncbi:hypothetical protein AVEN_240172-1 [Araneus ventricosus]|uniref:Integrase catalytic domain-containing protein n=1 Tax=Araneus ventricosus TaxID=182803 RepID=A0A4Y2N8H8_ARAVE|nr:hypothetical protein AVEN_240172-1 [Araneus ventricosus]